MMTLDRTFDSVTSPTPPVVIGGEVLSTEALFSLLNRYQLLPQVVRAHIIDQAISPYTCEEAEQQAAIGQWCQRYQLPTQEAVMAWLQQQHLNWDDVLEMTARFVKLQKFKSATWSAQLEAYFMKRKVGFDQVVYSLMRTQDEGLAQELYYRISEGEQSFAEVAQQFSQGNESQNGGTIGPIPLSQPHPIIRTLLSVGEVGQVWEPRAINDWFVIVRLDQFISAQLDEAMQQQLLDELFETWLHEEIDRRLQSDYSLNFMDA